MAMSNSKGSSNIRNFMNPGKHAALLPPKSPFPSASPAYADYIPPSSIGSKAVQKPRDGHHQRTSSESLVMDEQPSWLDDLLNEPETPVRRGGHRRSSSDSFAYVDLANISKLDYLAQDEYRSKNLLSVPSWGSQEFDHLKDGWRAPFFAEANTSKQKNRMLELPSSAMSYVSSFPSSKEDMSNQISGSSSIPQDAGKISATSMQKQDQGESSVNASKAPDSRENLHSKPSASETDAKRANSKQQFAQRSRVRKLQYIAELERSVQALQAEGTEVTAQLEFLNQQHLILSMENKSLKQRLESLAQEQMIKYFEHEVLEREIGRLRTLYQQHQQQQLQQQHQQHKQGSSSSGHRRSSSKDLDSQLANLSLKHKDGNENMNGPIRS